MTAAAAVVHKATLQSHQLRVDVRSRWLVVAAADADAAGIGADIAAVAAVRTAM